MTEESLPKIKGLPKVPIEGIGQHRNYLIKWHRHLLPGAESGVYIIRRWDTELFKVGCSASLLDRIEEIKKSIKAFVTVELTIKYADHYRLEGAIHRHFATRHVGHEWFRLTPADLAWLAALNVDEFMNGDSQ